MTKILITDMNPRQTKSSSPTSRKHQSLRERLWKIIFEAETPAGKFFDVALLYLIGASVLAVMLETVEPFGSDWGSELNVAEWCFTVLFSVEYALRLWLSRKPLRYATSFFGIVDLLACLPQYLSLAFGPAQGFAVVRVLRLLRVFRVLKMVNHLRGAHELLRGLRRAKPKITVFFTAVLLLCTIAGTLLYFVEGTQPNSKFTSIPISIYYAVVSVTTVGYGDLTVKTDMGRFLTSLMILTGFAIIAVPSGIVTASLNEDGDDSDVDETTHACPACGVHGHLLDARFCRQCGHLLEVAPHPTSTKQNG